MIGLDTNVLVRYFAQDDDAQSKIATEHIEGEYDKEGFCFINHIVLCELAWVLQRSYNVTKKSIIEIIEQVLQTSQFKIQSPEVVWKALQEYRENPADFADYLVGETNKQKTCDYTATFDKKASKSNNFRLLKP